MESNVNAVPREPWNKGKIVGQKTPSRPRTSGHFEFAFKWKVACASLHGSTWESTASCVVATSSVSKSETCHGAQVASRAVVMQHKTPRPVQFEITQATRDAVQKWIKQAGLRSEDFLFPSRLHDSPHLGTRQYARILERWVEELGLDPANYGTHSMRQTKATLIYRRAKTLRAVQFLLGHSKLESTVRCLGIEVDDALEISEQTDLTEAVWARWLTATPYPDGRPASN